MQGLNICLLNVINVYRDGKVASPVVTYATPLDAIH